MSRVLFLIMPHSVEERKRRFLEKYNNSGTISKAAVDAGIERTIVYRWIKTDEKFAKEFEESKKTFSEKLEDIALDLVNQMRENGDYKHPTLLIALLNANNPAKYRGTAEVDNTARDFITGLRKLSKENREASQQSTESADIIPYEGAKEAIQKKFGSLKNGNTDKIN